MSGEGVVSITARDLQDLVTAARKVGGGTATRADRVVQLVKALRAEVEHVTALMEAVEDLERARRRVDELKAAKTKPATTTTKAAPASGGDGLKPAERARGRAWARKHGHHVGDVGRISAAVLVAYRQAHQ